jgi:hypothetical protein
MRSGEGWLTPESLREGLMEEYAVEIGDDVHTIVLGWAGMGTGFQWQVKRSIISRREGQVGVIESHAWWYDRLKLARWRWQEEVTSLRVTG